MSFTRLLPKDNPHVVFRLTFQALVVTIWFGNFLLWDTYEKRTPVCPCQPAGIIYHFLCHLSSLGMEKVIKKAYFSQKLAIRS